MTFTKSTRNRVCLRALAVLAASSLALAAGSAPAAASTGGAPTATAFDAQSGGGLAFSGLRAAGATWYGPGFYGNRTACGQTLRPRTVGVAHRSLPCGTQVRFVFRGRSMITRVIDRGPYSRGHAWDLTNGARRALRFEGSHVLRYAIARKFAQR
jgi:rare lipoprotein A (peptidoglycan hydrolase)